MDKIDKVTRSRVMASVRSEDTKPEMRVRSTAHKLGYRFRLHRKDLPGKPDIVFPSRRIVIFVHGCFWHGHNCQHGKRMPTTNEDYWNDKIKRNRERDDRVQKELIGIGWKPAVIWECQLNEEELSQRLTEVIG